MKILHYIQNNEISLSKRIKRAIKDQELALIAQGIPFTNDPKDDFDIVYVNEYSIETRRKMRKFKAQGYPIVYQANSNEENFRNTVHFANLISGLYRRFLLSSYSLADAIIVPTQHAKNVLRAYGMNHEIDVIPHPVDMEHFAYNAQKVQEFREFFKLDHGQSVVMGSGHAFERKGILDFLSVARAMPDIKFIWFGELDNKMIPHKVSKAIKQRSPNVIMAGYIEGNIYEGALSSADVYFYPSYEDTEVDSVIEAMASSTQVIVRDIDVYRPWLVDGESCYMAESNEDFVALIRACIIGKLTATQQAAYKLATSHTYELSGKLLKRRFEKLLEENNDETL